MKKLVRRGEEFWRGAISQQQASGLSVAAFCRQQDLGPNTFYKWRNKFQAEASQLVRVKKSRSSNRSLSNRDSGLLELVVQNANSVEANAARRVADDSQANAAKLLEVCLPGGVLLRFHGERSATDVSQYVVALSGHWQRAAGEE